MRYNCWASLQELVDEVPQNNHHPPVVPCHCALKFSTGSEILQCSRLTKCHKNPPTELLITCPFLLDHVASSCRSKMAMLQTPCIGLVVVYFQCKCSVRQSKHRDKAHITVIQWPREMKALPKKIFQQQHVQNLPNNSNNEAQGNTGCERTHSQSQCWNSVHQDLPAFAHDKCTPCLREASQDRCVDPSETSIVLI